MELFYIKIAIGLQRRPQKRSFLQLGPAASGDWGILVGVAGEG
jgi:hypothetical protein